jgi:xanthosine utilization system XapX-like protein
MVDITEISAIVTAAGVLVGVVYYILEIRHQTKIRQMDLVMRLFSTFASEEFQEEYIRFLDLEIKDYDDFVKTYGLKGMFRVYPFFEAVGILLNRKIISIDLVQQLFRESVPIIWEKGKLIQEGMRKKYNQPAWGEWFEYLYNEMKKREQRK